MIKAKHLAKELLQTAKQNEPMITEDLRQIAGLSQAKMVGLKNRFKTEESLVRKLIDNAELKGLPLKVIAKINNDTLRYTYLLSENDYLASFEKIKDEFRNRDYRIGRVFNAWNLHETLEDIGYRGINITIISSQKQKFELQLHTKDSFDLKTETHDLYKEFRNPTTSVERRSEITKIMVAKAVKLNKPKGL